MKRKNVQYDITYKFSFHTTLDMKCPQHFPFTGYQLRQKARFKMVGHANFAYDHRRISI